jgi:hypothetical protein
MATRIYAASDSNNQVKLQHVCTVPDVNKALLTALGAALVLKGARSAGFLAVGLTVGGAAILSRAISGKSLIEMLGLGGNGSARGTPNAASFRDEGRATSQEPEDTIDEAAMESFPASDPPASHHSSQLPPSD